MHIYLIGFTSEFRGLILRSHIPLTNTTLLSWSRPSYLIQILVPCAIDGQYMYPCIHSSCELWAWIVRDYGWITSSFFFW